MAVWDGGTHRGPGAIASFLGIHQGSLAVTLSIAAMLRSRAGVLTWRAQAARRTYRVPVAG
ncbi:hypothetical protein AB0D04_16830 [Streptomyces sp. NPDC048483]|uniref:hypothetical protein n=1 Tax=Streptomyces sp. NPDC048483 TaxID=3154927 RepID=UPI0034377B3B